MSKWLQAKLSTLSNVETTFVNEALDRMGYKADFAQKKLMRPEGDYQEVDCVVVDKESEKPIGVGLRFHAEKDGAVSMAVVADWFYSHTTSKGFTEQFTIEYNTAKYISAAENMNFAVESIENMADGRRRIVVARAA